MGRTPLLVVALVVALALAAPAYALGDPTAPTSSAKPPAASNSANFDIPYTVSDGASGSGIASVDLYAKGPNDSGFIKVATDTTPATPSFPYAAAEGDGTYSFYTRATDKLSNQEPDHARADGSTLVDTPKVLVASVSLPKGQDLNSVLQKGLALELIAYRQVSLKLELSVTPRTATALRLRNPWVAVHNWQVIMPKTYPLRLRLNRATIRRLRKVKRVHFELRSVLSTPGGNSIATNPLTFGRP